MHVLQNAFESNWYGPDSTNTSPKEKWRTKRRMKKKPAKEVGVFGRRRGRGEGDGEHANASRPGVNYGVLTQLSES